MTYDYFPLPISQIVFLSQQILNRTANDQYN